jgi:hypothetical protein
MHGSAVSQPRRLGRLRYFTVAQDLVDRASAFYMYVWASGLSEGKWTVMVRLAMLRPLAGYALREWVLRGLICSLTFAFMHHSHVLSPCPARQRANAGCSFYWEFPAGPNVFAFCLVRKEAANASVGGQTARWHGCSQGFETVPALLWPSSPTGGTNAIPLLLGRCTAGR